MIVHAKPRTFRYRGACTGARLGGGRGTIGAPARRPVRGRGIGPGPLALASSRPASWAPDTSEWGIGPGPLALATGTDAGSVPARAGSWKVLKV